MAQKIRHTMQTTNHWQTLQTTTWSTCCGSTNKFAGLKKCNVQTIILNNIVQVLWYTFQNHSHINQYFIPTRWINPTILWGIQTKKMPVKILPYARKFLPDLNTFLRIPDHHQILIIKLWFWEKLIIWMAPLCVINNIWLL